MQRPVTIVDKPFVFPFVCTGCGINERREFFVDLGIDIIEPFNPIQDGVLYLCNECMEGIIQDYYNKRNAWNASNHAVNGTYKYLEDTDGTDDDGTSIGEVDLSPDAGEAIANQPVDGSDEPNGGNDQPAEPSDSSSDGENSDFLLELRLFSDAASRQSRTGVLGG